MDDQPNWNTMWEFLHQCVMADAGNSFRVSRVDEMLEVELCHFDGDLIWAEYKSFSRSMQEDRGAMLRAVQDMSRALNRHIRECKNNG